MAPSSNTNEPYLGSIVAFEGDRFDISTQLRLLPRSKDILTVPPLEDAVAETSGVDFSAREFVCQVHEIFTARFNAAQKFVLSASGAHPRLVFWNGGSAAAKKLCITEIEEKLTNGDIEEARTVFEGIIRNGVAGLKAPQKEQRVNLRKLQVQYNEEKDDELAEMVQDATTIAMRKAEELDRETAVLQKIYDSYSVTAYRNPEDDIKTTILTIPDPTPPRTTRKRAGSRNDKRLTFGSTTYSPRLDGEGKMEGFDIEHGLSHRPSFVEVGAARVVDVKSGSTVHVLKKSRSLDRLAVEESKARRVAAYAEPWETHERERRLSTGSILFRQNSFPSLYPMTSNKIFPKASETVIKNGRSVFTQSSLTTVGKGRQQVVEVTKRQTDTIARKQSAVKFEPVFPGVEDLTIQFTGENNDELLDSLTNSNRNSTCSFSPRPLLPQFWTPRQSTMARNSYIPYQNGDPLTPAASSQGGFEPPSPIISEKLQKFNVSEGKMAIEVQNRLRELLDLHFPPPMMNLKPAPWDVDADWLWKPLFLSNPEDEDLSIVRQIIAIGSEAGVDKDFTSIITGRINQIGSKSSGISKSGKVDLRYLMSAAMQTFSTLPPETQAVLSPFSHPENLAAVLIDQLDSYWRLNGSIHLLVLQYPPSHLPTVLAMRTILGSEVLKVAGIINSASEPARSIRSGNYGRSRSNRSSVSSRYRRPNSIESDPRASRTYDPATINPFSYHPAAATPITSPLSTEYSHAQQQIIPSFAKADFLLPSTATPQEISSFISAIRDPLASKSFFYATSPPTSPLPRVPSMASTPEVTPIRLADNLNSLKPSTSSGSSRSHRNSSGNGTISLRTPNFPLDNQKPMHHQIHHKTSNQTMRTHKSGRSTKSQGRDSTNSHSSPSHEREYTHAAPQFAAPALRTNTSSPVYSQPGLEVYTPGTPPGYAPSINSVNTAATGMTTATEKAYGISGYAPGLPTAGNGLIRKMASQSAMQKERKLEQEWENFLLEEEESQDETERRLMPDRTIKSSKPASRKAMKWLGIS